MVAGLVGGGRRLLLGKKAGKESSWSPRTGQKVSGVMQKGSNLKAGTILLKEAHKGQDHPQGHTARWPVEQGWHGPWRSPCLKLGSRTDYISAEPGSGPVQTQAAPSQAAPEPPAQDGKDHKNGSRVHLIRPLNKVRSKELFH